MLRSLSLAAAIIVAPAFAVHGNAQAPQEAYSGKIAVATKSVLTIVTRQGENVEFAIAADCKIVRDGKPVGAEMLGTGDMVSIQAVEEGDKHVAKSIVARSATVPASRSFAGP